MPIRSHLNGHRFDPETMRLMGIAYEMTLISLRLVDRGDIVNNVSDSPIPLFRWLDFFVGLSANASRPRD